MKIPITNKEDWECVTKAESFQIFVINKNVEFFQITRHQIHYYDREIMAYEGIVINYKTNTNFNNNLIEYINKH